MEAKALEESALLLSAPDVLGATKRRIVGLVIEPVACRKNGDVYFFSGFGIKKLEAMEETLQETLHREQTLDWLAA